MKKAFASILSCDILRVHEEIQKLWDAGIRRLHIDLMDGVVTDKIFLGEDAVKRIKEGFPEMEIECHLMVCNPLNTIKNLELQELSCVIVHMTPCLKEVATYMRMHNGKLGIAISPDEELEEIYIPENTEKILIMGVPPGRGGQKMLPDTGKRIRKVRDAYKNMIFGVDGGVNIETIESVIDADDFVIGSCLFKEEDPEQVYVRIQEILLRSE
ncbi:ribulose-phosphate 3-epimerase [Nematocida sp. LUAm3]|nr:ribulose-phosphate 3-epimerase [Nematocida sp. LUAm3]KAI5175127.1 ribulose-phosphate 3-epimerase [Nematocida sp. LUAm2]KAI5178201.1 ribulose-phosphate 3-epimerase [Nematocida sp. LUAm1]